MYKLSVSQSVGRRQSCVLDGLDVAGEAGVEGEAAVVEFPHVEPGHVEAVPCRHQRQEEVVLVHPPGKHLLLPGLHLGRPQGDLLRLDPLRERQSH